jgi:Ca2+-binding EF-hand superfamily protein
MDVSALWQDLLKRADKDGDGKISREEFEAALGRGADRASGGGRNPMKLFEKADSDGDGKISKSDFQSALSQGTDSATAGAVFDAMDTNQDGVVSAAEYAAAMQKMDLLGQLLGPQGFSTLA